MSCNYESNTSLGNELPMTSVDSTNLENYILEFKKMTEISEDSLKSVSDAIISKYPNNKALVSIKLAHQYYKKSKFYLARYYFSLAASVYKKSHMQKEYAEMLTNIGVLSEMMGDYPYATNKYFEALSIFDTLNLEYKKSFVYNNLGIVYQKLEQKEKAISYYKKSLAIVLDMDKTDQIGSKYNNIATVFEEFDNKLDSALVYYRKAYQTFKHDSTRIVTPIIMANIANIYTTQGELNIADSILIIAYKQSSNSNNEVALHTINRFRARLLLLQKKYHQSEELALKTIHEAEKQSLKEHEFETRLVLIDNYKAQRKYKLAFHNLQKQVDLEKEIKGMKQKREIEKLNIKYEVQKRDHKIKLLQIENEINMDKSKSFAIGGVLVLISLLSWLYIISLRKNKAELQVKGMRRDIKDYIKQLHDLELKEKQEEQSAELLFLDKIKQFNLSSREKEVLIYISKGYKNAEIAESLFVSINTIKHHIKNIFLKLDVRNRIEAVKKASVNPTRS